MGSAALSAADPGDTESLYLTVLRIDCSDDVGTGGGVFAISASWFAI